MLTKTITYIDFDGVERKEKHYFNLTKAEMLEFDSKYVDKGGIMKYLTWLVDNNDENKHANELIQVFKEMILRSYGERTSTGRFVKSQEIRDAFMATDAYSELFMEVVSSQEAATAFVNALFSGIPEVKKALEDGTIKYPTDDPADATVVG